jgi:hypothetical protein
LATSELRLEQLAAAARGFLGALVGEELRVAGGEVVGLRAAEQEQDVERVLVAPAVRVLAVVDLVDLRDHERRQHELAGANRYRKRPCDIQSPPE